MQRRPRKLRRRRRKQTKFARHHDRNVIKLSGPSGTHAEREWKYLLQAKPGPDPVAPHIVGLHKQHFTTEVIPQSFKEDLVLLVSCVTFVQIRSGQRHPADIFYMSRINRPGLFYYFPDLPWNCWKRMKRIIHFLLSRRCLRVQTVFGIDFKRLYRTLKERHKGEESKLSLHPVFDHLSVERMVRLNLHTRYVNKRERDAWRPPDQSDSGSDLDFGLPGLSPELARELGLPPGFAWG